MLQQILFYRGMGVGLDTIKQIVTAPILTALLFCGSITRLYAGNVHDCKT